MVRATLPHASATLLTWFDAKHSVQHCGYPDCVGAAEELVLVEDVVLEVVVLLLVEVELVVDEVFGHC